MGIKIKEVDTYIAKSAEFANPILNKIRILVHGACPDVEEKIKWSFPHFDYKGEMMCSMASFTHHCAFNFWKSSLMKDPAKILQRGDEKTAMGSFGQIKSLKDLPADKIFISYIKEAAKLNKDGVKLPSKPKSTQKKELIVPDFFLKAVRKNKTAYKTFEAFSYSHKKEYVEWVTEAKTEETRHNRLATTVEWLSEGKSRNWKYAKC